MESELRSLTDEWETREGFVIFGTTDKVHPHIDYIVNVCLSEDKFLIASENLTQSKQFIREGSQGTILFMTEAIQGIQIKGRVEILENGDQFRELFNEYDPDLSLDGLIILKIEQILRETAN